MNIVVDKSFLRSCKKSEITELCKQNNLLMTESLLYELLKDSNNRMNLFLKFDQDRLYSLIPNMFTALEYEIKYQIPFGLPSKHIVIRDYSNHSNFISLDFEFSSKQINQINNRKIWLDEYKELFLNIIDNTMKNKNVLVFDALIDNCYSKSFIIKQYEELKFDKFNIKPSNIDNNWAIYIWLQLMNIYSINLAYKYESIDTIRESSKAQEKITHDLLDMEYLLMGLLENCIASNDKNIVKLFKRISNNGYVYTKQY